MYSSHPVSIYIYVLYVTRVLILCYACITRTATSRRSIKHLVSMVKNRFLEYKLISKGECEKKWKPHISIMRTYFVNKDKGFGRRGSVHIRKDSWADLGAGRFSSLATTSRFFYTLPLSLLFSCCNLAFYLLFYNGFSSLVNRVSLLFYLFSRLAYSNIIDSNPVVLQPILLSLISELRSCCHGDDGR